MKSRTIRLLVVLTLLSCVGIIAVQVYGLRRAYELQAQTFNLNAHAALRHTAEDIWREQQVQIPAYSPVEQLTPGYFVVQLNVPVSKDVLQHYLISSFTRQNISTDFAYCISDCNYSDGRLEYTGYYQMPGTPELTAAIPEFPKLKRENVYFGVYFPHRKQFISMQLNIWIISSIVLLAIMCFLAYLLFVIFQQRRLSEIQKDFVSNMTHEFKTPLASISLAAEVLRNPDIVNQPQRLLNYATIIANESAGLTAQVGRVLHMSQAERAGLQLKKEPFVWQQLIEEEVESMKLIACDNKMKITLELPEEKLAFCGDVLHLKNAIGNLLDNSIKYCEACPDIVLRLWQNAKAVHISVKDYGIGIDGAQQKMLFKKFYRVPKGDVHDVKGFGLGLSYVQLIAQAHGGTISCSSSLGKGSIFTLTFPLL